MFGGGSRITGMLEGAIIVLYLTCQKIGDAIEGTSILKLAKIDGTIAPSVLTPLHRHSV